MNVTTWSKMFLLREMKKVPAALIKRYVFYVFCKWEPSYFMHWYLYLHVVRLKLLNLFYDAGWNPEPQQGIEMACGFFFKLDCSKENECENTWACLMCNNI